MMALWPQDWRAELAKVFDYSDSRPLVQVVFIDQDGKQVGEPLEIVVCTYLPATPHDAKAHTA
jgi:hypothetical protein